jgi:uncharacterized protein YggU (UPF0235/DUF167 family)
MLMKERGLQTRIDVTYPYDKIDEQTGQVLERLEQPPTFDVKFIYAKGKRNQPLFKIFAQRIDLPSEQYEIVISGQRKIKGVMKQFGHEYINIINHLRIMGDALVLLNPIKKPADASSLT